MLAQGAPLRWLLRVAAEHEGKAIQAEKGTVEQTQENISVTGCAELFRRIGGQLKRVNRHTAV